MLDFIDIILKNSWHDGHGNTLTFYINKENSKLYLCVDGSECCEGIVEKTDGSVESVIESLEWYNYTELKNIYCQWIKNFKVLA